ncbi:HobA family DNA replication regulator [Campylobacter corcagiensis]|uniref:HobA family DNA replication regulator n=1 Tax=Campylobacter corcagiensis TaxID=1448857 RepID=A0A7M1LES6_9BACT|nr:HobA family DNA replication regulator [Campylobacter corcagiensis]QOQ86950.1 HobA family DNA replication regulator [Campylobacter corcagiensis]
MKDLYKWSLERIRKDTFMSTWMEDRREEWTPLVASKVKFMLQGSSFIFFCDEQRRWFEKYALQNINARENERPLVPFFSLRAVASNLDYINTKESIELLNDMLTLAFPNGYMFFYVGRGSHPLAKVAKSSENSYMWLIDEHSENAFYLDSQDENLDIKLIQLFKLFDSSVSAALFDEVTL